MVPWKLFIVVYPVFKVPLQGFCFLLCSSIWNIFLSLLILFNFLCLYESWVKQLPTPVLRPLREQLYGDLHQLKWALVGSWTWNEHKLCFLSGFTGRQCPSGRLAWSLGLEPEAGACLPFPILGPSPPCQGSEATLARCQMCTSTHRDAAREHAVVWSWSVLFSLECVQGCWS